LRVYLLLLSFKLEVTINRSGAHVHTLPDSDVQLTSWAGICLSLLRRFRNIASLARRNQSKFRYRVVFRCRMSR